MTSATIQPAYKGDPSIKAKLLAAIEADQKADAIRQGSYLVEFGNSVGFQGCAVGCAVAAFRGVVEQDNWHRALEQDTNIPAQINHVIDGMFEALPSGEAPQFVWDVFEAAPTGADLSMVVSHLMLDVLDGEEYGLSRLPDLPDDVAKAIEAVSTCYRRRLDGDEPSETEWNKAGDLARAARDAWDARAAWAARDAWVRWSADRLIHHLRNAPVLAAV